MSPATATIPVRLWSPNVSNNWHWAQRSRHTGAVLRATWATLGKCHAPPTGKRRVEVTLIGPRDLDPDNATAACKPLLDAIRRLGWLVDDSPAHLELVVSQERGKSHAVRVKLGDCQKIDAKGPGSNLAGGVCGSGQEGVKVDS